MSINYYFIFNRHILMVDLANIHNDYQFQNRYELIQIETDLCSLKFTFKNQICFDILIEFNFEDLGLRFVQIKVFEIFLFCIEDTWRHQFNHPGHYLFISKFGSHTIYKKCANIASHKVPPLPYNICCNNTLEESSVLGNQDLIL